jgi:photosystem II stability/assembly factor-like uncharacterized protein
MQNLKDEVELTMRAGIARSPLWIVFCLVMLLLAACGSGGNSGSAASATPTEVPVNGFGTSANHVHSLIALPGGVLVLATHYGIFRSPDNGATWTKVSSGPNQPMQGLMEDSLVSSPLNPQRLYVLTQLAVAHPKGTLGLYTSTDQGRTWQLTVTTASMGTMFFIAAGNETPDQAFIYLPALGPQGLKMSLDAGAHFSPAGPLPFGNIWGMLAIPGSPGDLLIYGSDGIARSTDAGKHWQVLTGITGGVFDMVMSRAHAPIYAAGDAGMYVSTDNGKSFQLVYTKSSFGSLTASPVQPELLYGETGTAIYRSADGGHTWSQLPPIKGNLGNLAADPANAALLYLSLSYPTQVYRFNEESRQWSSLTPKA